MPLILMGVRQTGKTYLLEQFGLENFKNYHIINFEEQELAKNIFEGNLDPAKILTELSFYLKREIDIHKDLVIFDEIQECPRALTSLKYFCEKMPELALCSAGSLLGLHLKEGSFPVGKVDIKHLYPLSFNEFLQGLGEEKLLEYLKSLRLENPLNSAVLHQQLWERLKHYFICGGLPEVVAIFIKEQDNLYKAFTAIRVKQEELIKGYLADMAKHAGKVKSMHLARTWSSIPKQLAENMDQDTNRFKFKGVVPNINRYSQLVNVLEWLEATELIIKVPIVYNVEQPLKAFSKDNMFKLMIFDVGILGALSGLFPEAIYSYDYGTYKGYFAENYLAQQLINLGHKNIFSWQLDRSEVEFLVEDKGRIIPIEVKSGYITKAKSLDKYIRKYSPPISIIFSANPLSFDQNKNVLHLPLYSANRLNNIMGSLK